MSIRLLFVFTLFFATTAFSQNTGSIKGRVTSAAGMKITAAENAASVCRKPGY